MTVVLKQLPHERVVVRKRAATCLGSVAVVVSEALLNRLAVHLLQKISESPPADVVRTLIQVRKGKGKGGWKGNAVSAKEDWRWCRVRGGGGVVETQELQV